MTVAEIAADLRAEQDALDALVAPLEPGDFERPTASPGWRVRDQLGHLAYFDGTAAMAIRDEAAFMAGMQELLSRGPDAIGAAVLSDRTTGEVLDAWRTARADLADAASGLGEDARVPWYGPSMGARSFLTARLMECWAHGRDVADAVGAVHEATDRLRHVAQLGFITRGWSYRNRGEVAPDSPVRVELAAPSGAVWTWGESGAEQSITGPAEDFCLVVTQRRHVDDTALVVTGADARDWMLKAQAFAGPATDGPPAGR